MSNSKCRETVFKSGVSRTCTVEPGRPYHIVRCYYGSTLFNTVMTIYPEKIVFAWEKCGRLVDK